MASSRPLALGLASVLVGYLAFASSPAAAGEAKKPLKYQFKAGETYVYEVNIVGDAGTVTQTTKGHVLLKVKSADAGQMQITPQVLLSTQTKNAAPVKGGFKGPSGGPGGPKFVGPREVTVDPSGKVLKASGQTALPLLLGAAEELVIEPLSPKGEKSWGGEKDLVIREAQQAFTFGPRGPTNVTNTSAKEQVNYEVTSAGDSAVKIKKSYELKTVAAEGEAARIQLKGAGELTFDPQAGLMKAGEFKGALVLHEKNVTVNIPVTVTYRLLDAAQATAFQKELDEKRAKLVEAAKAANAQKAITDADLTMVLADLKSGNRLTARNAADRLGKSVPIEARREEVAAELAGALKDATMRLQITKALKVWGTDKAVTPLLKHPEWPVRMEACRILAEVGTKASLEALRAAQSDSNRLVSNEAGKALKSVEGRSN